MTLSGLLGAIAVLLIIVFFALGRLVSNRPLTRADALAIYFRGQLTPLAVVFTISGRGRAMTAACLLSIAAFALLHRSLAVPLVLTASQLLSQVVVNSIKSAYTRLRPDYWLVGLEAGHSYPSGHATTAVIFYLGWAVAIALSPLPAALQFALIAALSVWALGIMWSRLALGAHYLTDVAGGVLFGGAWLCALVSILSHFHAIVRIRG